MAFSLRYGINSSLTLDAPSGGLTVCDSPRGAAVADLPAAVAAALAAPLDYPPLAQAVLPGDKVTLALAPDLPRPEVLLAALVAVLAAAGVEAADITLLRTEGATGEIGPSPTVTHAPGQRDSLGFLGSTSGGDEIYLNRALADADVVISLGVPRLELAAGYYGVQGSVYPAFADAKTQARYRNLDQRGTPAEALRQARSDVEDAARQLGSQFTLQVVPGAGDDVLHVLAGLSGSVERRGRELLQAAWTFDVPARAELVIAAIAGSAERQTWHALGRAVTAALPVLADDGAIAVCCDLAALPGPAVESLAFGDDRRAALRHWKKHAPADFLPALQLAEAMERGRVYLLSRLDETLVEELGMAAIANGAELARLATRKGACLVLPGADHVRVTVRGEET